MSVFFLPLLPLAIPYILGGLDFLRQALFPPAADTEPVGEPFTPPFTGGQCPTLYNVVWRVRVINQFNPNPPFSQLTNTDRGQPVPAPISGITAMLISENTDGTDTWRVFIGQTQMTEFSGLIDNIEVSIVSVSRVDGQPDNCGNVSNPNPAPDVNGDGIAGSNDPDLDGANAVKVVEGAPLVSLPNFAVALAAALAAAKVAADALAAARAIADALDLLRPLLEKLNEDQEDKDGDGKRDVIRYQFGSIRQDGFLRFYPNASVSGYKAEQLDINVLSIPLYYGKFFGNLSPNFYRFKSLGYIAFVSSTFGILEYREIEFARMSLVVPDDCIGFFYNLGLENEIVANAWAYYTQPQESG